MAISILHRVSGFGLATVGGLVLIWWLLALAGGQDSYATFQAVMGSPIGIVVLIGLTWALYEHMGSGLRHFVMDIGAGFELRTNKFWAVAIMAIAPILTVLTWAWLFLR